MWRGPVQTATPRPFEQSCLAARLKRPRRVARPDSNSHALVHSAPPGSNGHAALVQTRMPRVPFPIATPHGEARFKRPRFGSARHARFTRPRRYQWEPSCFAPRFKRPRRATRETVTTRGQAPFKRLRFGSKRDSRPKRSRRYFSNNQLRAPVQTVTACGKARIKRSRLGPKRDA